MASFEPFVSSDPFNMETFNTKLGGAFGKVDADVKSALLTPVLLYSGQIGEIEVSFTTSIPENAKFISVSTNNILNIFNGIFPIVDKEKLGILQILGSATYGPDPNILLMYFYNIALTKTGIRLFDCTAFQYNKNNYALSGYTQPKSALVKVYAF